MGLKERGESPHGLLSEPHGGGGTFPEVEKAMTKGL